MVNMQNKAKSASLSVLKLNYNAKANPNPYKLKIIKMYWSSTTRKPFIPLRKNFSVTHPTEWSDSNPCCLYFGFVGGDMITRRFTINAKFEFDDGNGNNVLVRAKAVKMNSFFDLDVDAITGAAPMTVNLGFSNEVIVSREKEIESNQFLNITNSTIFSFNSFGIKGFSICNITFVFMYKNKDNQWVNMKPINSIVYFLPSYPNKPWIIDVLSNQNPWSDALDMLYKWKLSGMSLKTEISKQITKFVNESINFIYDIDFGATILSESNELNLTNLIVDIKQNKPIKGNCSDCAAIVCILSNLLGSRLKQIVFGGRQTFKCNKVKIIGFDHIWQYPFPKNDKGERLDFTNKSAAYGGFFYHEIAFDGEGVYVDYIYDACLKVNKNVLNSKSSESMLPADIQFALLNDGEYRILNSSDDIKYREMLIKNTIVDLENGFINKERRCSIK